MTVYAQVAKRVQRRPREGVKGGRGVKGAMKGGSGDEEGSGGSEDYSESGNGESEDAIMDDDEDEDEDEDDEDSDEDDEDEDSDEDEGEDDGASGDDDDEDGDDDVPEAPPFTLTTHTATSSPIYLTVLPAPPRLRQTCVICPVRELRTDSDVADHMGSKVHKKFAQRFQHRLTDNSLPAPSSDPRIVAAEIHAQAQAQLVLHAAPSGSSSAADKSTEAAASSAKNEKKAERRKRQREANAKRKAKMARKAAENLKAPDGEAGQDADSKEVKGKEKRDGEKSTKGLKPTEKPMAAESEAQIKSDKSGEKKAKKPVDEGKTGTKAKRPADQVPPKAGRQMKKVKT